jgi:hypothetical protein
LGEAEIIMIDKHSARKFDGKSFGYYGGSFSKEVAERVKHKIMSTGGQVRITKAKESHPTEGRKVIFYRIWMR